MTEYELIDAFNSTGANLLTDMQFMFTVLSGYVVLAYLVGSKLTVFQVSFINFAYSVIMLAHIRALDSIFRRTQRLGKQLQELNHEVAWTPIPPDLPLIINLLVLLGSLLFMWQIRHPKARKQTAKAGAAP